MRHDYDFIAMTYDPFLYFAINPIRIVVMNELSKNKEHTILDLCCGTGSQLKLLAKNGFKNLHGLDISDSMLEILRKDRYSIETYIEDATKTGFENESFDVVIISLAIHEKDRRTQERLLDEAHRILKEGGILLVVDFIFDSNTSNFIRWGISFVEGIAGKEHYTNFRNYIRNNGLKSLVKKEKFKPIKNIRKLMNGITISIYQKINTA